MNERIRLLAKQATTIEVLSGRGFDTTQYTERFSKEKFAELIVRECADIAITAASDTNFITGISEADKRALSIAVEIKHHFGVEE